MRDLVRTPARALAFAAVALSVACSLGVDFDQFTEGDAAAVPAAPTEAAAPMDAAVAMEAEAATPVACPNAERECIPAAPPGWTGPIVLLAEVDGGSATGACPPSFAKSTTLYLGASVANEPATCGACSCGPVTGRACPSSFQMLTNGQPSCGGNTCGTYTLSTTCADIPQQAGPCTSAESLMVIDGPKSPTGGSCAANPATVEQKPPVSTTAALCTPDVALERSACAEGSVCVATAALGAGRTCISQEGDVACPGDPWTSKHLYHRSLRDDRGCTPCTCGAPTGGSCTPVATFYANAGCSGASVPITGQACQNGAFPAHVRGTFNLQAGSCAAAPDGGRPKGTVTPEGPVTICCRD